MREPWEEKKELAPGIFQLLKCTEDKKGRITKVDAGYKEVDGVRTKKESPVRIPPTSMAEIDLNQPLNKMESDFVLRDLAKKSLLT